MLVALMETNPPKTATKIGPIEKFDHQNDRNAKAKGRRIARITGADIARHKNKIGTQLVAQKYLKEYNRKWAIAKTNQIAHYATRLRAGKF